MYCQNCGKPSSYTSRKPNFCESCGFSFKTGEVEKSQATAGLEEDEVSLNINISDLDFEIERFEPPTVTLGEIAGTASETPAKKGKAKKNPKRSKKAAEAAKQKTLDDFQKEAGTLRNQGS